MAGICAGDIDYKATPRGDSLIQGMAPKAKLMTYKVLTAYGSGSATSIIMAIEDAVRRGAHIINLSLGDPSGDPLSPEAVAANNAMSAGVIVVAAAGNSGPGPGTVGTPGAALHVITTSWSHITNWRIRRSVPHQGAHPPLSCRVLRPPSPGDLPRGCGRSAPWSGTLFL